MARNSEIDKMFRTINRVMKLKGKMVERGLRVAKANCTQCDGKDTMILRLHPQRRSRSGFHVHWGCKKCGKWGME